MVVLFSPLRLCDYWGVLAPTGRKPSRDPSVLLDSDEVQSLGDVGLHRIQMAWRLYEAINLFLFWCRGKVLQRQEGWSTWLLMPGPCEESRWLRVWALHRNRKPVGVVTGSKARAPAFILSFKNCYLLLRNFPRVPNIDSTHTHTQKPSKPKPKSCSVAKE